MFEKSAFRKKKKNGKKWQCASNRLRDVFYQVYPPPVIHFFGFLTSKETFKVDIKTDWKVH